MSRLLQWLRTGRLPGDAGNVERSLQHSWPWPPWVALALVLLAIGVTLYCYTRQRVEGGRWRRAALPAMRILSLLLVLTMMYGWTWQRFRTDLPDLLLVVDVSASMLHQDGGEASRIERVREALLEDEGSPLEALKEKYRVRLFFLSAEVREAGVDLREALTELRPDPQAKLYQATRLGDGVAQLLRQQRSRPTAAVLLLTDGVSTVGAPLSAAAEEAARRGTPLHLVGVGDDRAERDLRLAELTYPKTVFPDDLVQLDAKLFGAGLAGQEVEVRLQRGGETVARQQVTIPQRGPAAVRLAYRAEDSGLVRLDLVATPLPGESNPNNNRVTAEITVRDETIRVLMLQHHPSFDFQFLKMLLGRGLRRDRPDEAVELTVVLQDSDPEHAAQDADAERVFPASQEELWSYDVVILGDSDPRGLSRSQMESLVEFVAVRGGALALLSGPRHMPLGWRDTPLEPLMPVNLETASLPPADALLDEPFYPRLTPLGADMPHLQLAEQPADNTAIWSRMPPMYWAVQTSEVRPGVRVLVEHSRRRMADGAPMPLVCSRFYGAGMMLWHATDESYRWVAHPDDREVYARYWLQTLRHLARGKLAEQGSVELTTDAETYRQGSPVRLRARFWDEQLAPAADDGTLVVVEGNGRRRRVRLQRTGSARGRFEATAEGLEPGSYRVWLAAPSLDQPPAAAEFEVAEPQSETTRLRADTDALREAARVSGGRYAALDRFDSLLERLPAGRQPRLAPLPPRPLWNSNWLAAALVLTLTAEWLLRRRSGLS